MGRGTSDTETETTTTVRPRALSDQTMQYATRRAVHGIADQADDVQHWFGMFARNPEWRETLEGYVRQLYATAEAYEELLAASGGLRVDDGDHDPRLSAADKIDHLATQMWDEGWTEDSIRLGVIGETLRKDAVDPQGADERGAATEKLRQELVGDTEIGIISRDRLVSLAADAERRDTEIPVFVMQVRIERVVAEGPGYEPYLGADYHGLAAELVSAFSEKTVR